MRISSAFAALLLTTSVLVSGCSDLKDAAGDTAGDAACSVAGSAVDGVTGQVDTAVDEIGVDPAAARDSLAGLRDVLDRARSSVSGDAKDALATAVRALGRLADQAAEAARGADIDTSAVRRAQRAFGNAIDGLGDLC